MRISSPHNPVVKFVRSLERSSVRRDQRLYLIEGIRLVREAVAARQLATIVLYDPDLLSRSEAGSRLIADLPGWAMQHFEVSERVLEAVAQTESPSGVVAVLRRVDADPLDSLADQHFGVVLDGMADPGNAGTILRTADAAGVSFVASTHGAVDLFAPKVVRAGMGAHFRLPLYPGLSWTEIGEALVGMVFVGIDAASEQSLYGFRWPERSVLVVGGEARGFSTESRNWIHGSVRIPMRHTVESLNASVAASLAIYAALGSHIEAPERYINGRST